jgi:peptidyl-dipeptidase A
MLPILLFVSLAAQPSPALAWRSWSAKAVEDAVRSGRLVFVDFTADYCTVCKVNKKTVIETPEVRERLDKLGAVAFQADFTEGAQDIFDELAKFKREGVPLNLIYPAGRPDAPIVLPPSLTKEVLLAKLDEAAKSGAPGKATTGSTAADAAAFMEQLERELLDLVVARERTSWVKSTFITHDTDIIAAKAAEDVMEYVSRKADEAKRFVKLELPPELARKFNLLRLSLSLPAPSDAKKRGELATIAAELESMYGAGKYCPDASSTFPPTKFSQPPDESGCYTLTEFSKILAKSRDPAELRNAWSMWHATARPMREKYVRFVELANEGAKEFGFADVGGLWKSRYDMPADEFEKEIERLWQQVAPLHEQLHCYARARLQKQYGKEVVPDGKPIPAHLLGNMWSQDFINIFEFLAPEEKTAFDLDKILEERKIDPIGMVKQAEAFFVSVGLDPLPTTFWDRSLFTKPRDREVVCHASAWDIDYIDDLRIKMCIEPTGEDFTTIHHELGHNYYQRAYNNLSTLFMDSANDGFHEALGDTIALSVTPSYLVRIGYLDKEPPDSLNPLMMRALDKIAFLPFGLVVDKWRFDVFAGRTKPENYNAHWWELRTKYQGVAPPVQRTEQDFDPGAKYHVPANTPYTRYFMATILQFQFHRALCRIAGHEGPLHTCSIYGNSEAGRRLNEMMMMGLSQPWPEAMKALTGETRMDASAIVEYFQPLLDWLKEQNKGAKCGW